MSPKDRQLYLWAYMRAARALLHAGTSGRGMHDAWVLRELGLPHPIARLQWLGLRFYISLCATALPQTEVSVMPDGQYGPVIPPGVRAIQFLQSTPRGLIWLETIRLFSLVHDPHMSTVSHPDGCRMRATLQQLGWAPRQKARNSSVHQDLNNSGWVVDLFTDGEVQSILRMDAPPRHFEDLDTDDPLLTALARTLPFAAHNMCRLASHMLQCDITDTECSSNAFHRHIRNAIYRFSASETTDCMRASRGANRERRRGM